MTMTTDSTIESQITTTTANSPKTTTLASQTSGPTQSSPVTLTASPVTPVETTESATLSTDDIEGTRLKCM